MSIEFDCTNCKQSLRTPAGSEGKKVRCPECETVNIIPNSSVGTPEISDSRLGSPAPSAMPLPSVVGTSPSPKTDNPFSAPNAGYEKIPIGRLEGGGELTHHRIEFNDVVTQTWERYKAQLGMCILFTLIFFAISVVSGVFGQIPQIAANVIDNAAIVGLLFLVSFVVQQIVGAYQQAVAKRFSVNVVRGQEPLDNIFSFDGVTTLIGIFLLIGLASLALLAIVAAPALIAGAIGEDALPIGVLISFLVGVVAFVGFFVFMLRYLPCCLLRC